MDLAIVRWVTQSLHNPFLDWLMPLITALGEGGAVWIALCLGLLLFPKTRRCGVLCALALVLTLISGEAVLKPIFQRARPFTHLPELALLIAPPRTFSFPSGHTASSFAAAVALFLQNRKWGVAALALAALIGFSRLYLSVHYPTDILAGALLGAACAFAARRLLVRWEKTHRAL